MSEDWIDARLARFEARELKDKRRMEWHNNAVAAAPSMLQELKHRVVKDVEEYNKRFFKHTGCNASVTSNGTGFEVKSSRRSVFVSAAGPTVIALKYLSDMQPEESYRIEVAADDDGVIRYKYRDKLLADVSEASEAVLDSIIC